MAAVPDGIEVPAGQDLIHRPSTRPDEVAQPTPPSQRAELIRAAYVVAASIGMLGWLYFIWAALIFIWIEVITGLLRFLG